jgi:arsenate reductase
MFGPVSGTHFNPVVSLADAALGGISWRDALAYLPAQVAGCVTGAVAANLMFARAAVSVSVKHRASGAHALSEVIATAGLLLVIFALARSGRGATATAPAAVGAYIGAAYWFTASTSFANPAITVGRMFSDSFAGIAPSPASVFIAAQLGGGIAGVLIIRFLYPSLSPAQAAEAVVPYEGSGAAGQDGGRHVTSRVARLPVPSTRTSPSAASPTTSPARFRTGGTSPTASSPTWSRR